jgi:hypothetical protein
MKKKIPIHKKLLSLFRKLRQQIDVNQVAHLLNYVENKLNLGRKAQIASFRTFFSQS